MKNGYLSSNLYLDFDWLKDWNWYVDDLLWVDLIVESISKGLGSIYKSRWLMILISKTQESIVYIGWLKEKCDDFEFDIKGFTVIFSCRCILIKSEVLTEIEGLLKVVDSCFVSEVYDFVYLIWKGKTCKTKVVDSCFVGSDLYTLR